MPPDETVVSSVVGIPGSDRRLSARCPPSTCGGVDPGEACWRSSLGGRTASKHVCWDVILYLSGNNSHRPKTSHKMISSLRIN
jgi:hypothetical protein